ncbi:hypothetical protein KAT36_01745 [Candidatus Pacearchaeota archaeon]|nr:hypothetical protein [Candidatus Pacearchaeota archaeon]
MNKNIISKEKELNETLKKLVVARIEASMSSTLKLSIGSDGSLTKNQMIEHVMGGDNIGKRIIQTHLNFMRAQATGQLTTALNTV